MPVYEKLLNKAGEKQRLVTERQQKKLQEEMLDWSFKPFVTPKTKEIMKLNKTPVIERLTQSIQSSCKKQSPPKEHIIKPQNKSKKQSPEKLIFKLDDAADLEFSPKPLQVNQREIIIEEDKSKEVQLFIDVHLDDQSTHRLELYEGGKCVI